MTVSEATVVRYRVEAFLLRHKIAPTTFGRLVASDNRLVADMRAGRRLRPATKGAVLGFMLGYERGLKSK